MKKFIFSLYRSYIISKLNAANKGNQFINDTLESLGLATIGLPKYLNHPPCPVRKSEQVFKPKDDSLNFSFGELTKESLEDLRRQIIEKAKLLESNNKAFDELKGNTTKAIHPQNEFEFLRYKVKQAKGYINGAEVAFNSAEINLETSIIEHFKRKLEWIKTSLFGDKSVLLTTCRVDKNNADEYLVTLTSLAELPKDEINQFLSHVYQCGVDTGVLVRFQNETSAI